MFLIKTSKFKRVLAYTVDIGLVIIISILITIILHYVLEIRSKELDLSIRSFTFLGYLFLCMYFYDFKSIGMKMFSLKFVSERPKYEIGFLRVLLFHGVLGMLVSCLIVGLNVLFMSPSSLVGWLCILIFFINFLPGYFFSSRIYLHELISGLSIRDEVII